MASLSELIGGDLIIPSVDIVLGDVIGGGGVGQVYKASWQGSGGGTVVAVKKCVLSSATAQVLLISWNILLRILTREIALSYNKKLQRTL